MKAELIDYMGDDLAVVNAARVSFDKESDWEIGFAEGYDTKLKEQDERLIRYLARNNHWSPFSHAVVKVRETVPIFVARQRFKHTVGFTYNEVSRRYVSDLPEFYTPDVWRGAPVNAKQGSSGEIENQPYCNQQIKWVHAVAKIAYDTLLTEGVAPEQARMVLPQSMYTSYIVTGSLAAWARAYKLRSDTHAQVEIQDLAKQWDAILAPLFPVSWRELIGT